MDEPEVHLDGEPAVSLESEGSPDVEEMPHRVDGDAGWDDVGADAPSDGADDRVESPDVPEPADSAKSHPVRDRLLAKAAAARKPRSAAENSAGVQTSSVAKPLIRSFDDELERIAAGHRSTQRSVVRHSRALSPNWIAIFGSLFGLAMMASLFAVLVHVDPREPGSIQATEPETSAASATDAPEEEPEAAKPRVKKRPRTKIPGPWRIADEKGPGFKKLEGTIGREPFLRAIQDAGLEKRQAYRALIALRGLKDLDKCDHRDRFVALVERGSGKLKAFEYIVSAEEVYQAKEGSDGLLKGARLDLKVERHRVQGAVAHDRGSFSESAAAAGFEAGLASVVDEALDGRVRSSDFRRGDRLRIVAQEVTVLGEFARYAGVEAIEYVPADGDPLRVYYFKGPKSRGYFNSRGRAPYEGGWRKPIKDAPVTSKFNPKRMHPVLKKVMPHNGTDFGAPMGTPVGASAPGTISFIGYSGASGNLVLVDHAGSIQTGYAHLSRFAEGLKVGDHIDRLGLVGYVGSTGRSTGPHLHFSAKKDGHFIDAESLKLDSFMVLPADERELFAQVKRKLDGLLDAIALPKPLKVAAPAPAETEAPATAAAGENEAETAGNEAEASGNEAETEVAAGPDPAEETAAAEPARGAPPPAKAPVPVAAAKNAGASSIYLTDRELMQMQGMTDDGEVSE